MDGTPEQKKALVIWRLRRDLESMKELCLKKEREGLSKKDLRKLLVEINCYYEDLQRRLLF